MNTDRLVRTFQELVSIDSPSFDERRMADELAGRLKELGFAVSEDGAGEYYGGTAGNLYAYREGTLPGEPLLFSTHMDTVEPARGKRAVLHADGRITSAGDTVLGADCMAGTAALLEALAELKEEFDKNGMQSESLLSILKENLAEDAKYQEDCDIAHMLDALFAK